MKTLTFKAFVLTVSLFLMGCNPFIPIEDSRIIGLFPLTKSENRSKSISSPPPFLLPNEQKEFKFTTHNQHLKRQHREITWLQAIEIARSAVNPPSGSTAFVLEKQSHLTVLFLQPQENLKTSKHILAQYTLSKNL